jgi:pantoate--beta-alanine ligase
VTNAVIFRTVHSIRDALRPLRSTSRIGLVPTMGALHAGHVSLFSAARRDCDVVVASMFVNPSQFGDPADLAAYPRQEQRDAEMAAQAGVDMLFVPATEEMYPPGFASWVDVAGPAIGLEGEHRPGHFRGVATVCLKLFEIVRPSVAFFGQKDAQQVAVVKRMVRDFNLELELKTIPTVRDADGLALSSRNARLAPDERERALSIPRALEAGRSAYRAGRDPLAAAKAALAPLEPDYVAVADFDGVRTLAIAARVGRTRLIDNVVLENEAEP